MTNYNCTYHPSDKSGISKHIDMTTIKVSGNLGPDHGQTQIGQSQVHTEIGQGQGQTQIGHGEEQIQSIS